MKKLAILLILLVLLLVSAVLASPVYDVIDLGTLPGGIQSSALSINDDGQIVGWDYNASIFRAILFDSTGSGNNIDLGTLGGNYSGAYSINNNGQIVGHSKNADGETRATLFDSTGDGNNIDLGTLGDEGGYAHSINNNGQIVGWAWDAAQQVHATLFDPSGDGNNIDLGTLGGNYSEAYSINDKGQIVGRADNRATLFDPTGDGNNIDLGTLGGISSQAWSINNSGQIVGWAYAAANQARATFFDPTGDGNNIDLGTPPGFSESHAYSINNSGQIVGSVSSGTGFSWATLFDPTGDGNNIDLNTLIDPTSGWTLWAALSINDNGWIVGWGTSPVGQSRAFLLKPVNTAPVAIAGPNQVAYICIDDTAEVTLDGSASNDDNNDVLDYYWSWVIDSNVFEANGVSPTIQLPAGEHEIELVVYDGFDFSEPDYCTITVVEPLYTKLFVMPRMLNTQSRRRTITAMVCMPEGISPEDIDANEPLIFIPGQVESTRQFVFQWQKHGRPCTWIIASFDKDDCMDDLSLGTNRIKVAGRLNSGQCFYGNSSIYLYTPRPFRWPWKHRRHFRR